MVATAAQHVTLTADGITIRGLRGQTAPVLTAGFGGWSQIARPRRKALTQWTGGEPLELTFSILFDGIPDGSSVEDDCLALERIARPADGSEPPVVRHGGGMPHPELDWIVGGLAWDPAPEYAQSGNRIRHEATVKLTEHVPADAIPTAASVAAAKAGGVGGRTYIVKAGDTLSSIAASQLGDYKKWTVIASLNGIRDPKAITPNQRLRLP